jgi:hypothetical protein
VRHTKDIAAWSVEAGAVCSLQRLRRLGIIRPIWIVKWHSVPLVARGRWSFVSAQSVVTKSLSKRPKALRCFAHDCSRCVPVVVVQKVGFPVNDGEEFVGLHARNQNVPAATALQAAIEMPAARHGLMPSSRSTANHPAISNRCGSISGGVGGMPSLLVFTVPPKSLGTLPLPAARRCPRRTSPRG